MADNPSDMAARMMALGGRVSSNVEDVRAFPPRANVRSSNFPQFYDPAKGGYKDSFTDFVLNVLRSGLNKRKDQKYGNMSEDEWYNGLSPEEKSQFDHAYEVMSAPYLGDK
jgi:hypothetical protein